MKTKTLAAIGILLTVVTLGFASTEKAVDRPPGIAADQWYPISDRLGLVISDYQPGIDPVVDGRVLPPPPADAVLPRSSADAASASALPALTGYLVIKHKGHWTRLSVVSLPVLPRGTEESSPNNRRTN